MMAGDFLDLDRDSGDNKIEVSNFLIFLRILFKLAEAC